MQTHKDSTKDTLIKIIGWAVLLFLGYGLFYNLFLYEEPQTTYRTDPVKQKSLQEAYEQGAIDVPERPGDPYRGNNY